MSDSIEEKQPETDGKFPENPFFDRHIEHAIHWHNLPHWNQKGKFCFVTWRLADSLPQEKLRAWVSERDTWLREHPQPWDTKTKKTYRTMFTERFENWLDAGYGSCLLRDPEVARILADALHHFDGQRYALGAYVVMPNHAHALFALGDHYDIQSVMKSWKGYTAHAINKHLGRHGALWQGDYWDRLLRSEDFLERCMNYIRENPEKAGLQDHEYLHYEDKHLRALITSWAGESGDTI